MSHKLFHNYTESRGRGAVGLVGSGRRYGNQHRPMSYVPPRVYIALRDRLPAYQRKTKSDRQLLATAMATSNPP